MPAFKELPEFINGFRVIEDLGNIGKRRLLIAECKICNQKFKTEIQLLKKRLSCSRICYKKLWVSQLKEYAGFKILKVGKVINSNREIIAECKICLNPFKSWLKNLKRTAHCGCGNYAVGYNPRLIRIRRNMLSRCYVKSHVSYPNYGGRGIKICDEWKKPCNSFFEWALANGYKDELTLDRINNDGNYEPSNCRWATRKEQMANTRLSKKEVGCT